MKYRIRHILGDIIGMVSISSIAYGAYVIAWAVQ